VRETIKFNFVSTIDEAMEIALMPAKAPGRTAGKQAAEKPARNSRPRKVAAAGRK
jgi:hypothetical protein